MVTISKTTDLLRRVMNYRNEKVVKRISKDTGCSYREAFEVFEDTKRFLYLCGVHDGGFTPSSKIDDGWHAFILHTKDYLDFCMNYFGKFIHHYPNRDDFSSQKSKEQVEKTLDAAYSVFGKLSKRWNYIKENLIPSGEVLVPCSDKPCNSCSGTSSCQSSDPD